MAEATHRTGIPSRRAIHLAEQTQPFAPYRNGAGNPIRPNYVLVEVTATGEIKASGIAHVEGVPTHYAPPAFSSLPAAIVAAHQWAECHGVRHVMLKDCGDA